MKNPKTRPIAVLTSDIHFNIQTLSLASAALKQAVDYANTHSLQLIVAGDIHDSKANIRGECIKAILDILESAKTRPYVIVANHDRLNEKSPEHSLEFLRNSVDLVTSPVLVKPYGHLVPYYHDVGELRSYLKTLPTRSRIIMHQGLQGSDSGEYIQDKSALTYDDVKDFRVISGHYHRRQDIKTGRPQAGAVGLFSYIGNPYTLGFGEAEHPEKGFQVLMDDGTLQFVPTNLRRHIIINMTKYPDNRYWHITGKVPLDEIKETDILWVKAQGTRGVLQELDKEKVSLFLGRKLSFRLDTIPTDEEVKVSEKQKSLSQPELLDSLIEGASSSPEEVKALWRVLCE